MRNRRRNRSLVVPMTCVGIVGTVALVARYSWLATFAHGHTPLVLALLVLAALGFLAAKHAIRTRRAERALLREQYAREAARARIRGEEIPTMPKARNQVAGWARTNHAWLAAIYAATAILTFRVLWVALSPVLAEPGHGTLAAVMGAYAITLAVGTVVWFSRVSGEHRPAAMAVAIGFYAWTATPFQTRGVVVIGILAAAVIAAARAWHFRTRPDPEPELIEPPITPADYWAATFGAPNGRLPGSVMTDIIPIFPKEQL